MELNILEVNVLHYQHWISHNHVKTKCHFLHPYLSMKQRSFFCFVVIRSTELGCFRSCSWYLWKALNKEGCMGFGSMTFGLAVQKFLDIE
jgi:putative component of membrane protein insertase Oxa1/YidC/SpoIIIJ protein YidD